MQKFFSAESEEASKVLQNEDDLKLLFYGKNIYFYSLKFAKVQTLLTVSTDVALSSDFFWILELSPAQFLFVK